MLARQWQMGEFQGEDSGALAGVRVSTLTGKIYGWQPENKSIGPDYINGASPLESIVANEDFIRDFSLRIELGQIFERLMKDKYPDELQAFRQAEAGQLSIPQGAFIDADTQRFLNACKGHALDGLAILENSPGVPPVKSDIMELFSKWVKEVYGILPATEASQPVSWNPERLEYGVEVYSTAPRGGISLLSAGLHSDRDLGWSSFTVRSSDTSSFPVKSESLAKKSEFSIMPTRVRFRGRPNARFWDFDDARFDVGSIKPDKQDLSKLIFMDFMLLHGNDWFMFPLKQEIGTLCEIDQLVVYDVFGGTTTVPRADLNPGPKGERWTLFSTSIDGDDKSVAPFFILPGFASVAALESQPLEDVRFFRDETADMAWAVEHTIQNGMGNPKSGHEHSQEKSSSDSSEKKSVPAGALPIKYRIESDIPDNWFPFIPVQIDPNTVPLIGRTAFELGLMVRGADSERTPSGRILRMHPYRMREETLPQSPICVQRVVHRSRWVDGSTHVWITRRKQFSTGEGSSGLRFDYAEPDIVESR
jgi:hypothetical protein